MFLLFYLLIVLLVPNIVSAVVISSPIITSTTWSPINNPYIITNTFTVAEEATLTIEPGVIVKASAGGIGMPSIFGKLIVNGTRDNPVHFTSLEDDSVGGDSGLDGESTGAPGQWRGLFFKSGSVGEFDNVIIRNAGAGLFINENVGINNDRGKVSIRNSKIYDNFATLFDVSRGFYRSGTGIYNKGELTIDNSVIDNHTYGIFDEIGTTTITNTEIKNNTSQAIVAYGFDPITLLNNNFINNKKLGEIEISRPFIHENNISSDQTNKGFETGGYVSSDTILHSRDLPIIATRILVEPGATLTIQEGSVIKMKTAPAYGNIEVQGKLKAEGTKDKRITITSIRDDTLMGDTNGDGPSSPAPRDWDALYFHNGSEGVFDYTDIKYGGSDLSASRARGVISSIYDRGANLQISNSSFSHSYGASLFKDAGSAYITKSEIYNNPHYGMQFRGDNITISSSSLFANIVAIYNEGTTTIDARHNWWGDASGPHDNSTTSPSGTGDEIEGLILYKPFLTSAPTTTPTINPVIIIPGIMGSAYKDGKWLIDPIFHIYDNLIETLEANGYEKNVNLFPFGYDWRKSNTETAIILKQKIDEVKSICECEKVDIVAHSMGGLVARVYAQSPDYENDIDQLIFLGTPHRGAPQDYLVWEAGEFKKDLQSNFVKSHYEKEAKKHGYNNLFDYIHNWPIKSVQELLPVYDYLYSATTSSNLIYPVGYPENDFLKNLNQDLVSLLESDVDITNIFGNTGSGTISKIRIVNSNKLPLWQHGYPENYDSLSGDRGLELGIGDGTVPTYSSKFNNPYDLEIDSGHINLPTDAEEEIYAEIHGGTLTTAVKKSIPLKILYTKIFSPADFVIIAPDGKKMGKNFATGGEYNEISGAFYSGFNTEDEYITIPNPLDGEYKIELQGTGNGGSYLFETTYISDNETKESGLNGVIAPNQITNIELDVNNINPENTKMERVIDLDTLINDIKGAYNLGWIKDVRTRDFIIKQAKFILKLQLINGKYEYRVDKILLVLLKTELSVLLKKGKITKEAFDLLNQDLKFIINNY